MIIENTIKFGYGDIAVGAKPDQRITFQQFKPPKECGASVSDNVEFIGEKIIIDISYDDYCGLCKYLKMIYNKEANEFIFKDYIFDFTNYNEESINTVKRKLDASMYYYFFCCAA